MKKLLALAMAVIMVFALCAVAFAAGDGSTAGQGVEVPVDKTIYLRNAINGTYSRPQVTFTFEIEPVTDPTELAIATQKVNGDAVYVTGTTVMPGPADGVRGKTVDSETYYAETTGYNSSTLKTTVTLTFKAKDIDNVNPESVATTETMRLLINEAAFITNAQQPTNSNKPGVYRYKITDVTTAAALQEGGIVRSPDYDATRYLDVYMIRGADGNIHQETVIVSDEKVTPTVTGAAPDQVYSDTEATPGTYDTDTTIVDGDGNIWTQTNPSATDAVFPDDYTNTGKTAAGDKVLEKDGTGFGDAPTEVIDSVTGDPIEIPAEDEEGNPIGTDDKSYPAPEYYVDPTSGQIFTLDPANPPADPENPVPGDYTVPVKDASDNDVYQLTYTKMAYHGDTYTSYNVILKKEVAGALAELDRQFGFTVNVTNGVNNIPFSAAKDGESFASHTGTASTTLCHGETYHVRGLHPNATINYTETNTSPLVYKASVKTKGGDFDSQVTLANGETRNAFTSAQAITTGYTSTQEGTLTSVQETVFQNYYSETSPTGVILRFAPYVLMLGAAMCFIVLSRRQREQENA